MSIEDELNMTREKLIDGDLEVVIPEDIDKQDLELIIKLALKSYAEQMEVISFLEIKNRMKAYEVAERYLGQAKDARYKLDRLNIERDKARGKSGTRSSKESTGEEIEQMEEKSEGRSRKEIMASRVKKLQ